MCVCKSSGNEYRITECDSMIGDKGLLYIMKRIWKRSEAHISSLIGEQKYTQYTVHTVYIYTQYIP